jgi:hypothetical protein
MKCIYCGTRTDTHSPHCIVKLLADNTELRFLLEERAYHEALVLSEQAMVRIRKLEAVARAAPDHWHRDKLPCALCDALKDLTGGQNDLCSDS